ncbi:MAG: YitT family protein [Candidatus Cryptobacteroides sp.]
MKSNKVVSVIWDYILLSLGTLLYCMGWTSFLIPNGIASGGLTGLCTILQFGTGIPIGWSFPILNTMLLLIGVLFLGKAFGFKTIYVIALSSLLFEVLPHFPVLEVTDIPDKLLVALVGAALESIGIGLTLLRGGSTGGTDIIAMVVNKYWPVSPGRVYLVTDIFIISLMLFVPDKGIVDMIYGFVVMLVFSFGVDFVLLGNKSSVQILVFSPKYAEIADHVINNVHRGVTALQSVGWYSQTESKVLLIISRKHQMNEVINAIRSIDKKAFISVSSANSVYGEGFEEIKTGLKLKKKDQQEQDQLKK